jgi:hypothetical protein
LRNGSVLWPVGRVVAFHSYRRLSEVPTIDGWDYQGYWIDSVGNRTLQNGTYTANSSMTIESRVSFCASGQYLYGGVEYGSECFCARSVLAGTAATNEAEFNMPCNGNTNNNESCGGSNRLNLFKMLTYSGPVIAPGSSGYTYAGCFNDTVGSRTLSYTADITNFTVEVCLSACHVRGFKYAGVEYSRECYCDNSLRNGGTLAIDGEAQCNMACDGNKREFCGGPVRLNMYVASDSQTGDIISDSQTDGLPNTIQGLLTSWTSQGCFSDRVDGRTLSNSIEIPCRSSNMTVEACVKTCAAQGFSIAGVGRSESRLATAV